MNQASAALAEIASVAAMPSFNRSSSTAARHASTTASMSSVEEFGQPKPQWTVPNHLDFGEENVQREPEA